MALHPTKRYWFPDAPSRPNPSVRLFCLPYAGGNAATFRNWIAALAPFAEVVPLQLPGRGAHVQSRPFTSMPELVIAIAGAISHLLDLPFAIFGHSMGATIGFELARHLRDEHVVEPFHFFASGRGGLRIKSPRRPTYNLPESDFVEILRDLNGTPSEVVANQELLQMYLPLLRADFELTQTYRYQFKPKLQFPITALGGTRDPDISEQSLHAWSDETASTFSLRMFEGNHFFIHQNDMEILHILAKELSNRTRNHITNQNNSTSRSTKNQPHNR